VLSQFYRAFLAVLAPDLQADLGATPGDLALDVLAVVPGLRRHAVPVGAASDRIWARRTAATLLGLAGGGGALLFALAQTPSTSWAPWR
jgi:hypothetical protein